MACVYYIDGYEFNREEFLRYVKTFDQDTLAQITPLMKKRISETYRSSHFPDEPNILAHIRFNERNVDGKKVLFIEEVQSDWHQEGRKKGYNNIIKNVITEIPEGTVFEQDSRGKWFVKNENGWLGVTQGDSKAESEQKYLNFLNKKAQKQLLGVPDAPFKKSWHELAFKKMLRFAVENDFDSVAWTTGEQQNERYDLSKQVDVIKYKVNQNGNFDLTPIKDGEKVESEQLQNVKPENLDDVIGKEVAQKIKDSGEKSGELRGDDLKIEGTGMKGFYDKILPSFVNKYTKKWGGKVGTSDLKLNDYRIQQTADRFAVISSDPHEVIREYPTQELAQNFIKTRGKTAETVHSLTITDAMRESVAQGQPLFKRRTAKDVDTLKNKLPFMPLEDVLYGAESTLRGENLELNEHSSEIVRRLLSENNSQSDEQEFDGITMSARDIQKIVRTGRPFIETFRELGYTDADLKGFTTLLNNLEKTAKRAKDYGILYVYDDVLPEEETHREDLRAGRTDQQAIEEMKQSPFWTDSGDIFNKEYPNLHDRDKASEIAAKLLTDQAEFYGWNEIENFEEEKQNFLDAWADGIIRNNEDVIADIGYEAFKAKYTRITKYGTYQTADAKGQRNRSDGEVSGKTDEGKRTEPLPEKPKRESEGIQTRTETQEAQSESDRRLSGDGLKKSNTPQTLREAGIPLEDRFYAPTSNAAQKAVADNLLEKGFTEAKEWFDANKGIQTGGDWTAVGVTLMNEAGKRGDIKTVNKIADDLVPALTDAGQAIQAMAVVGMFNPEMAGTYAAKVKKQRTGKDLTKKEYDNAVKHAETVSTLVKAEELGKWAEKELKAELDKAQKDLAEMEEAYKLVARSNDLRGIKLNAKAQEIRNLQAKIKRLQEQRPKPQRASLLQKALQKTAEQDEAVLRQLFGERPLMSVVKSTSEILRSVPKLELTDEQRIALVRQTQRMIVADKPLNYEQTIKALAKITDNQLSGKQIQEIHADAVNSIIDAQTSARANEKARIFAQHKKEAAKVALSDKALQKAFVKLLNKQSREAFKENSEKLTPLADAITEIATTFKEQNGELTPIYSAEATWLAFNRESNSDTKNIKAEFQKEFPEASDADFRQAIREADTLFTDAKMLLNKHRLETRANTKLDAQAVENIQKDLANTRIQKSIATRKANRFYSALTKGWMRTAVETTLNYRKVNLLLGIPTHLRNIVGNTSHLTTAEVSRFIGAVADIAAAKVTKVRTFEGINLKSLQQAFKSLYKADDVFKNMGRESGFKEFMNVMRYGTSSEELESLQLAESALAERFEGKILNTGGKVMDAYINFVFRTMSAEDMVFKAFAFRRRIEEMARLEAKNKGGTKEEIETERQKLLLDPTELMKFEAMQFALEMTFQNDNVISDVVKKVRNPNTEYEGLNLTLEAATGIIAPFDRTPTNILLRMLEYSPVGIAKSAYALAKIKGAPTKAFDRKYRPVISEDVRNMADLPLNERAAVITDLVNKAYTQSRQREFAKQFGRGTLGTAGIIIGYQLGVAGLLTGLISWDDDDKKEKNEAISRKSVGIEDRSFSTRYGRFVLPDDPFFKMVTVGASIYEQEQLDRKDNKETTWGNTAWQTSAAFGRIAEDQPLVHGIKDYYTKTSKGKFGELGGNLLGTFFPASSLMRGIGEVVDEKARTGSGFYQENGKWKYSQMKGFRNSATKNIPILRNYAADESTFIKPEIRGNALIRFGAMFDPFKTRPAQDYRIGMKPKPQPKPTVKKPK